MLVSKITVTNFRSFGREQSFKPHPTLSVLVGPNEAGKTSLLEALAAVGRGIRNDQVRSGAENSEIRVELVPEEDDRKAIEAAGIECASVSITYSTERSSTTWDIKPAPPKRVFSDIEDLFENAVESLGGRGPAFANRRVSFVQLYEDESPSRSDRDDVRQIFTNLKKQQPLPEEVNALQDAVLSETGFELALSAIDPRIPKVLEFDDMHRELKSSYPLNRVNSHNQKQPNWLPLDNILNLADLDLNALPPEQGKQQIRVNDANGRLRERFAELWGESKPYPQIGINNHQVHVSVRDPGNPDQDGLAAEQRSSGVIRMFELIAFVGRAEDAGKRVVVLADEIEQHLHYDAQVELLEWLERGALKAQIITSTHSIGCWPSDIGSQMNALERRNGETVIHNGPYSRLEAGAGGLMASIGATRAAIGLRRHVIFCEGKNDEMLLPALFRDAGCDTDRIWFVGSISNSNRTVPPRYSSLEIERFILDGDESGAKMLQKLTDADHERVGKCFLLNNGGPRNLHTVEDLIEKDLLTECFQAWWESRFDSACPHLDLERPVIAQIKLAVVREHTDDGDARSKAMASFKSWLRERALDRSRDNCRILRPEHDAHLNALWVSLSIN